jgi:peptidyl-prolyl cis-trans isomerase C
MATTDSSPPPKASLEPEPSKASVANPVSSSDAAGQRWLVRVIREPLLHFLVVGAVIFSLYFWVSAPTVSATSTTQIEVSAPTIEFLKADWQRQWGRSPNGSELQTLIDQYIHDEVFYQEALALGLDGNDIIVRRRLIQKVEFLAEDVSALQEPSDQVLSDYLDAHVEQFHIPGRVSFSQVYFSRELRGNDAEADATALLKQLQANPSKSVAGDRSMLPTSFTLASFQEIAGLFGEGFARAITAVEAPGWQGPLRSAYGVHLVNVSQVEPGHPATLAEVRGDVRPGLFARSAATARRAVLPGSAIALQHCG